MSGSTSALEIARAIVSILEGEAGCDAALATVIRRAGSAPQVEGARLLLRSDGPMLGTVGGGAIEARVLEACRETLRSGLPRRVDANLVQDLGMCCGGSMEVFVEYLAPHPRLIVIGAGHVAQALVPMALQLGFRVIVVDDREDMLAHPSFAATDRRPFDADEILEAVDDLNERDHLIILTRDHLRDEKALSALLSEPHAYLGMIGSQRKVQRLLARIQRRHEAVVGAAVDFSRVHAPIGLALGGRTPAEIAVSIVAEFVALRHGGDASTMNVVPRFVPAAPTTASSDPAAVVKVKTTL